MSAITLWNREEGPRFRLILDLGICQVPRDQGNFSNSAGRFQPYWIRRSDTGSTMAHGMSSKARARSQFAKSRYAPLMILLYFSVVRLFLFSFRFHCRYCQTEFDTWSTILQSRNRSTCPREKSQDQSPSGTSPGLSSTATVLQMQQTT